jgi:hypothetical protein
MAVAEWQMLKIHYRSDDENLNTRDPDNTHATWRDNLRTSVWTPPTQQENNPFQIRAVDSSLKQWRMSGLSIVWGSWKSTAYQHSDTPMRSAVWIHAFFVTQ